MVAKSPIPPTRAKNFKASKATPPPPRVPVNKKAAVAGEVNSVPVKADQRVYTFTRRIPSQITLDIYLTYLKVFDSKGKAFDLIELIGQREGSLSAEIKVSGVNGSDATAYITYTFVGPLSGYVQVWDYIAQQGGWWLSNTFSF